MIKISQVLFSGLLIFSSLSINPAYAAPPDDTQKISEHLGFLGFKSDIDGDYLKATSPRYFNIYLSKSDYGIKLSVAFSTNKNAVKNQAKLIAILNQLNAESRVIKFYLYQGEIVFESHYTGRYERENFGIFMQTYLSDYDLVDQAYELADYIGN